MRLRIIRVATCTVLAPVEPQGQCRVREVMDALERSDKAAYHQVVALLDRVSRHDPRPTPGRRGISAMPSTNSRRPADGGSSTSSTAADSCICVELLRKPKARELRLTVRRARRTRHEYLVARTADAVLIEEPR